MKGNPTDVMPDGFTAVKDDAPFVAIESPEQVFERTFDAKALEEYKRKAVSYKQLTGRNDPFDPERMKQTLGAWSTLTQRTVITFLDACDHAIELCGLWAEEDVDLARITAQREEARQAEEVTAKTNIMVEGTKEYEIEQARLAWKEAVRQRDALMEEWNAYVAAMRTRYRALRDA